MTAWDSLCARNLIPFSPIVFGRPITNGDFRFAPTSRGFDWRLPLSPDINAVRLGESRLRIDLSGKQPEQCELLAQLVPLPGAQTCHFRFTHANCRLSSAESGLQWRILDTASPSLSSDGWKNVDLPFSTRDNRLGAAPALRYSRVPGTSRLEGSDYCRGVQLECAPENLFGPGAHHATLRRDSDTVGHLPMGSQSVPGRRLCARYCLGRVFSGPALRIERKHPP